MTRRLFTCLVVCCAMSGVALAQGGPDQVDYRSRRGGLSSTFFFAGQSNRATASRDRSQPSHEEAAAGQAGYEGYGPAAQGAYGQGDACGDDCGDDCCGRCCPCCPPPRPGLLSMICGGWCKRCPRCRRLKGRCECPQPSPPQSAAGVAYPYYNTRGPRDFFTTCRHNIGP